MKGEHDCWLDGRARAIGINMQKFAGSCYQFEHELIDKRLFFAFFLLLRSMYRPIQSVEALGFAQTQFHLHTNFI